MSKSRLIKLINWVQIMQLYGPILTLIFSTLVALQIFVKFGVHNYNFEVGLSARYQSLKSSLTVVFFPRRILLPRKLSASTLWSRPTAPTCCPSACLGRLCLRLFYSSGTSLEWEHPCSCWTSLPSRRRNRGK